MSITLKKHSRETTFYNGPFNVEIFLIPDRRLSIHTQVNPPCNNLKESYLQWDKLYLLTGSVLNFSLVVHSNEQSRGFIDLTLFDNYQDYHAEDSKYIRHWNVSLNQNETAPLNAVFTAPKDSYYYVTTRSPYYSNNAYIVPTQSHVSSEIRYLNASDWNGIKYAQKFTASDSITDDKDGTSKSIYEDTSLGAIFNPKKYMIVANSNVSGYLGTFSVTETARPVTYTVVAIGAVGVAGVGEAIVISILCIRCACRALRKRNENEMVFPVN